MTETTASRRRVLEDAKDVRLLEERLSIARRRLMLSEEDLDRSSNPRRQGAIDVIDAVLRNVIPRHIDATSTAIHVWCALRRNGLLMDESDGE